MSGQHCVIRYENEQFKLIDLQSKNGTLVNGTKVDEHVLEHGDRISIGDSTFRFVCQPEAESESVQLVDAPLGTVGADGAIRLRQKETLYLNPAKTEAIPRSSRRERDLHLLFAIATNIAAIRDRQLLQTQILETIFHGVPAQQGTILLAEEDFSEVKSATSWDSSTGATQAMQVPREIAVEAMSDGVGILISTPVMGAPKNNTGSSVTSLICVPLIAPSRALGVIYVQTSHPTIRFDSQHLELLTAVASLTALSLGSLAAFESLAIENRHLRALLEDFQQGRNGKSGH